MDGCHVPVLLRETIELLEPARGGTFLDCTLGLGGHAEAVLDASSETRVVGFDRDPRALALARARLARFGERLATVEADFRELARNVGSNIRFAGILADLGVSSLQLDDGRRGFSFRRDGPLDMRMGIRGRTAADLVNESTEGDLADIFRQYGEEPEARRVARALVERREREPIESTSELADVVRRAKRPRPGRDRVDPATRVFQALRIAINDELDAIEEMIDQAVKFLDRDGRLVVLSYHSLEDRIVKNRLRDLARGRVDPVTGRTLSETRVLDLLTRKPLRPSFDEIRANPRSRSARLRAARRL